MKKLKAAIVVIGFLLLSTIQVMASGQSDRSKKEPVTITFWKAPHSANEEAIMKPVIDKFMKENSNIKVDYLMTPWDSWIQKYTAAFASGMPPDVSYQVEWYPSFSASGMLADLTKYVNGEIKGRYPKSMWDYGTYGGQIIGVPFIFQSTMMFYNKDLFAKEGISVPKTWEEFRAAAKKLTKDTTGDGKIDQWGCIFSKDALSQYIYYPLQAGGDFLSRDKKELGFANPNGLKGIQFIYDLINVDKVSPTIDEMDNDQMYNAFYNGKIGMLNEAYSSTLVTSSKFNLGAFLLPAGPATDPVKARACYGGIGLLSMATASKHKDEAWALINFIATPDNEAMYDKAAGMMSPNPQVNKKIFPNDELMNVVSDTIPYVQFYPLDPKWKEIDTLLKTMFEEIATGKKLAQQALDDANNKAKEILK